MAGTAGKVGWKVVAAAFAIPTGIAVRKAIETGWRKTKHDDPPMNPADPVKWNPCFDDQPSIPVRSTDCGLLPNSLWRNPSASAP